MYCMCVCVICTSTTTASTYSTVSPTSVSRQRLGKPGAALSILMCLSHSRVHLPCVLCTSPPPPLRHDTHSLSFHESLPQCQGRRRHIYTRSPCVRHRIRLLCGSAECGVRSIVSYDRIGSQCGTPTWSLTLLIRCCDSTAPIISQDNFF